MLYNAGQELEDLTQSSLYIVQSGKVERTSTDGKITTFGPNEFFGAEDLILKSNSGGVTIKTLEPSGVFIIPGKAFADIPIVRWKLFETYGKRLTGE